MSWGRRILLALTCCCGITLAAPPDVELLLPRTLYAVTGSEIEVDFDNLILTERSQGESFEVTTPVGEASAFQWKVTPTPENVGRHPWSLKARRGGEVIAEGGSELVIVPAEAAAGRKIRLLIVGDSLTHASVTANDLQRRLAAPGQPTVTFLGTHRPASAAEGVVHEGYGGWTWQRFVTHYEPMPDPAQRKISSPFVFLNEGTPRLDVSRYFQQSLKGETPDVVFFFLGINDCFGANPEDRTALDAHISRVFEHAETLLATFRKAAPQADLAICLTPVANLRDGAFEANYKGRYPRWGWRRIQHRLVQRQIEHFSQREADRIFVVPLFPHVDPYAGYPVDNAVHPNAYGYQQLAGAMHAWLIAHLARTSSL